MWGGASWETRLSDTPAEIFVRQSKAQAPNVRSSTPPPHAPTVARTLISGPGDIRKVFHGGKKHLQKGPEIGGRVLVHKPFLASDKPNPPRGGAGV